MQQLFVVCVCDLLPYCDHAGHAGLGCGLVAARKLEAVCGKDVLAADCATDGLDLQCVADINEVIYNVNLGQPELDVGLIHRFQAGRAGSKFGV